LKTQNQTEVSELPRALGPIASIAILAGTVIGTGIFLVPSTVAREIGSVHGIFLIWLLGAFLSLAGALSYAELGARLPQSGGEYAFLRKAYGPIWGFLFGWQQIVIGKTGSIAAIAIAFSLFLSYEIPEIGSSTLGITLFSQNFYLTGIQLSAIASLATVTAINIAGVGVGGNVQTFLTFLKLTAIIGLAFVILNSGKGDWAHFGDGISSDHHGPLLVSSIGGALAAVLWAFDGWNNLTMVGEEIKNPQRTIPLVMVLGIIFVAAVYLLTNIAFLYAYPIESIKESQHIAQDIAKTILGSGAGQFITLAALISTYASLNGSVLSGARVFFAMSRDGYITKKASLLGAKNRTPSMSLLIQGLLATGIIVIFGHDKQAFERVLDYALFGTWGFYSITAFAVIIIRRAHQNQPSPFSTPGYPWVPALFGLVGLLFCLSIAFRRPNETLMGLLLLILGALYYLYATRFRARHSKNVIN
jgi:amino acid transporter